MKNNAAKVKLFLTATLLIGFVVNGVIITIYNVDKSTDTASITSQIDKLKMKNSKLTEQISQADSLTDLMRQSNEIGFQESSDILYFKQRDTIAQAR
ncbi:MAG: hypothetical protein UT39_C0003G0038 [Candidatus Woesebacteria bacterium GW2011_GWA1_39_21]|uniref:Septum formation initiator n=1 Tax=Candidatus Woesebacteria bacterium GW2011_GWA1_39_21 TaxID=1618550 RepID=A0A0G0N6F5_9BACT|nr:MAG: hypothetical protein UT39_C0003G0038 [Candidatus Woesebacteria bacterium GW2011_GWA1_39_21]